MNEEALERDCYFEMEREAYLFYWVWMRDLKLDLLFLWLIYASFFSKKFLKAGEPKSFFSYET